ncbi:MAG: amino acid ABC transporter ATP-binding protein [bacterium]
MTDEVVIKVDNITKSFTKKSTTFKAVDDVSLELHKGEIVCLLGPSGSGKSTVLRCIEDLETPEEGEIYIKGELFKQGNKNYASLRRTMGFVFQHFNLFPNMTTIQNLTLAPLKVMNMSPSEAEEVAMKYLGLVGLTDKRDEFPSKLSGGQKQRVAIARSLCLHPEVMLFDEPTSALDPEMVVEVLNVIKELADEGMTMMIVTHEMGFARTIADRIMFLEDGRLIEENTAEAFFSNPKSDRAKDFLSKVMY